MHLISHPYMFFALILCLCYSVLTMDSQKNSLEGPKRNPKLRLQKQCKIIALNLLGIPKTENWRGAGSCEQACKHQLLMLNQWMAEKQTAKFNVYKGHQGRRKAGPHFKIDSCLAEPRFCSQDFVYPSIEASKAVIAQLASSLALSASCICQRALVLTQVWEESASIANWLKLNPQISADERPSCTVENIRQRLQKNLATLGWQCSDSSHLVEPNVDCETRSEFAIQCPCALSTYTTGMTICPKETCRAWPLEFPTFGQPLAMQVADQTICVDVNGVKHIANAAYGRKIPLQTIRLMDLNAIMSSLQQNLAAIDNVLQPADEHGATFHSGAGPSPNNMHLNCASGGGSTSRTTSVAATAEGTAATQAYGMPINHGINHGLQLENSIESLADAGDIDRASSNSLRKPNNHEQFLMALQDIEQFLFADDLANFDEGNADLTSFSNMPMSADTRNLDPLPSLPMHASLEYGHERQQSDKRAGKRPRTEAGSSGTSTVAGSSSQLGSYSFMDAMTFQNVNRVNLDSMPRTQTVPYLPVTAAGPHNQCSHFHQPTQQYPLSQRGPVDSLDELSVIFGSIQEPANDDAEDKLEEDDPPIL